MEKTVRNNPSLPTRFPCAVCGIETHQHSGWFLLVENRWLDHLRILSWHPTLATQEDMLSVCGRQHLKIIITHWLSEGNLELQAGEMVRIPITSEIQTREEFVPFAIDWLVGELSVHRDNLSRAWTGSPETLACILNAITDDPEPRSPDLNFSVFDASADYYPETAVH